MQKKRQTSEILLQKYYKEYSRYKYEESSASRFLTKKVPKEKRIVDDESILIDKAAA